MTNDGEVQLSLPPQPELVGVARLTLAGLASRLGYDYDGVEDLRTAVAEALNLVLQAGHDAVLALGVVARWSAGELELTVRQHLRDGGAHRAPVAVPAGGSGNNGAVDDAGDDDIAVAVMVMEALVDEAVVHLPQTSGTGEYAEVRLRKARPSR